MSVRDWLVHHSATALTRLAGVLTLIALCMMVCPILVPGPIPIMVAMSIGQLLGVVSFLAFFLAVLIDAAKSGRSPSFPPSASDHEKPGL